jgi:hypothetical protein
MKQSTFFKYALVTNICFLFLVVYKSSRSIQLSYDRQAILNEKETLTHQQTELTHQVYARKNLTVIKQFALKELGMKPCTLHQVKQLTNTLATNTRTNPLRVDASDTNRIISHKAATNE